MKNKFIFLACRYIKLYSSFQKNFCLKLYKKMSDLKKNFQELKNNIDPYKKKFSDWYEKDDNVKKFKEGFSDYKKKFFDFYKLNNRNKNIVHIGGGAFVIIILGNGIFGSFQRNAAMKSCVPEYIPRNHAAYPFYKKYCSCVIDNASKGIDEYVVLGKCQHIIQSKRFENALMREMRGY